MPGERNYEKAKKACLLNIQVMTYVYVIDPERAKRLTIVVCWVPGHSGILGNEIPDRNVAVAALCSSGIEVSQVPYQYIKPLRNRFVNTGKKHVTHKKIINCIL